MTRPGQGIIRDRESVILSKLTERQRVIYSARVNDNRTWETIAALTGCNVRTVYREMATIRAVIVNIADAEPDTLPALDAEKEMGRRANHADIMHLSEVYVEFRDDAAVDTTLRTALLNDQKARPARKWAKITGKWRNNGVKIEES